MAKDRDDNRLRDGWKEVRFANGSYYQGEYINKTITGEGIMHYADGRVYEGSFLNGEWHGYGKATFPSNGECYEGYWRHNLREGNGKTTYRNQDGSLVSVITGTYHNDIADGHVRIEWSNGDAIEGQFTKYTPTGPVRYEYGPDREDFFLRGAVFEGRMDFINNTYVREGHGKIITSDGTVYEGEFRNNMMNGEFTIRYPDGITERATYADGRRVGNVAPRDQSSEDSPRKEYMRRMGKIAHPDKTSGKTPSQDYSRRIGNVSRRDKKSEETAGQDCSRRIGNVSRRDKNSGKPAPKRENSPEKKPMEGSRSTGSARSTGSTGSTSRKPAPGFKEKSRLGDADPQDKRFLHVQYQGNGKYAPELHNYFEGLIGMESVKDQLDKMYKRFRVDALRQKALGYSQTKPGYYFIITGNPGTGKTTVARIIGQMLRDMDFLPGEAFVEADRSRLVGQYIGQTAQLTTEVLTKARGGTLFIDEAYTLFRKNDEKDFGIEAIDTLLKDMEDHRGEYCCILAGYRGRMEDMMRNANPGLASRFDRKIHIPDYSADELVDILVSMAYARGFKIKKEARPVILARIQREKVDESFDNARCARRLLDEALERQAVRLAENLTDIDLEALQVLEPGDFGKLGTDASTLESCLAELNALTGLEEVKREVNRFVHAVKLQAESRKRGLAIAANPVSLNMVFLGNPGTGKTTVARLLSRIYYHLGLLKRPDVFVECVRADLVGRYQGETAIKVKQLTHAALGGLLFIDEAYSLVMGDNDSFGQEAVNTLVSEIENNRENLAVILAGYTREMEEFLNSNPGLRSRMPRVVTFSDYTADELMAIMRRDLEKRGYEAEISAPVLRRLIEQRMSARDFGNARGARNLCDEIIENHNARMNRVNFAELTNDDILSITDEDVKL